MNAPARIPIRPDGRLTRAGGEAEIRAVTARICGEHAFPILIQEAQRRAGNPDLAAALAGILAIYEDDSGAHQAAAEDVALAVRDACAGHGIEF